MKNKPQPKKPHVVKKLKYKDDFSILQFANRFDNLLYDVKGLMVNIPFAPQYVNTIIADKNWNIYKVSRNSDFHQFKVGDICETILGALPILDFQITGHEMYCKFDSFSQPLVSVQKAKVKLFTTHDGVDFFGEEIKLWYIKPGNWSPVEILSVNYWLQEECKQGEPVENLKNKWFSTKEAAEEYILLNEPLLSVNDVRSIKTRTIPQCLFSGQYEEIVMHSAALKNLAKSKQKP